MGRRPVALLPNAKSFSAVRSRGPRATAGTGQTTASLKLAPLKHVNLTDRVFAVLKERILSHDIEMGARLRDEELAPQLRVSRTPVREALMRLHQEGLVEVLPRSGTRVRTFTEEDIEQIYEVRIALEALAARRAAKRLTRQQVKRLKQMHDRAEKAMRKSDFRPALEFDLEMHQMILEAAGNRKLSEVMATINDFVALFRNLGAQLPAHRGYNYRHREIMRALEREDSEAAGRALGEHIEAAKEQLLRDLQERHFLKSIGSTTSPGRMFPEGA